jgi:hypothetical protein
VNLPVEALEHVDRFHVFAVGERQAEVGQGLFNVLLDPAGELGLFSAPCGEPGRKIAPDGVAQFSVVRPHHAAMNFLDIFRSKAGQCTSCRAISPCPHCVYAGLRRGSITDRLCTNCLISRLEAEIRGKGILFIEPLTTDGYCYFPLGEVGNQGLTQDRVRLALSCLAPMCADCSSVPYHLWMPLRDLDESAMQKQTRGGYYPIASEPACWRDTVSLCDGHAAARLRDCIERKRYAFLTFRFPQGGDSGYYS